MTKHTDLSLTYLESIPSGRTDELPLVIMIHGRGADMNDLADLAPAADGQRYRWIFPNAPQKWEYMPGYAQGFSWFDGWPPEGGSLEKSRETLIKFIYEVSDRYATPLSRMVISGFSQGAMMSLDVAYRLAGTVAGVIAMSGAVYEPGLINLQPKLAPTLMIHGEEDEVIPVQFARISRDLLKRHGIETEYHEFPMGHWVTPESLAVVKDFLAKVL